MEQTATSRLVGMERHLGRRFCFVLVEETANRCSDITLGGFVTIANG